MGYAKGVQVEKRIAFVKTAWSEYYQGGQVFGRYAYINEEGEGHEACNFLPDQNGKYLAYIPPIGKKFRPPQPNQKEGWLTIFVSAYRGNGPLTVVGWYRNARFEDEYKVRPEYEKRKPFQHTPKGDEFVYCVSAESAHLVLPSQRNITVSGAHFRRSPVIYVEGVGKKDEWRRDFAKLSKKIVSKKTTDNPDVPKLGLSFPDLKKRKEVEEAAISHVIKYLKKNNYKVSDKQKDNCGYDLLADHEEIGKTLHIEVKGTSLANERFFMSRNEWLYSDIKEWRLAIVSNCLTKPTMRILTKKQVMRQFEIEPLHYEGRRKADMA